jgi:hypothetical protein
VGIREWLWGFLPDQCEVDECRRFGMRGNENIVYPFPMVYPDMHIVMCDYCNSRYDSGEVLHVEGINYMVTKGDKIADFKQHKNRRYFTDKS